ncbi:thioesterase [Mediterraneibacter sp. NSJ-55]|uniref:Thioesterase n=1 Tax=Mediterraneibacter hominis TaxID=2763054 RepID=A0A923LJB1_9FIRM|nr:thioesterase domain-containing protein [Mediterraneibacter hominis]MBC5689815.1 thioesterase [Mediterraneibacter hominis]
MKLFCFTYAGGTAAFYDELKELLFPSGIEIRAIDYAGHGSRRSEELYKNFDDLACDLYKTVINEIYDQEEYALMGYSMGTIAVAEVMKLICKEKVKQPVHIFLAAHEPATKKEVLNPDSKEADVYIKNLVMRFGGVPEKLLKNEVFWRTYLPLYKGDFQLIWKYDFSKLELKTDVPAAIFYTEEDTPRDKLCGWNEYFVSRNEYYQFEGNHFFIKKHCKEIAEIIVKNLKGRQGNGI